MLQNPTHLAEDTHDIHVSVSDNGNVVATCGDQQVSHQLSAVGTLSGQLGITGSPDTPNTNAAGLAYGTGTISVSMDNVSAASAGFLAAGQSPQVMMRVPKLYRGGTVMPGTSSVEIMPAEAVSFSTIKMAGDGNLVGSNIKSGVSIFGVNGTYTGGGGSINKYWVQDGSNTVSSDKTTMTIPLPAGCDYTKIRGWSFDASWGGVYSLSSICSTDGWANTCICIAAACRATQSELNYIADTMGYGVTYLSGRWWLSTVGTCIKSLTSSTLTIWADGGGLFSASSYSGCIITIE